jgi:hypothetical protein
LALAVGVEKMLHAIPPHQHAEFFEQAHGVLNAIAAKKPSTVLAWVLPRAA